MKKMMLFTVILFCAVVAVIFWRKKEKKLSFDDITNGLSKDADRIEPSHDVDGIEWIDLLKKKQFVEYNGDPGNTARRSYIMYNSDNSELFTITDAGNRGIVIVKIRGAEKRYRVISAEE